MTALIILGCLFITAARDCTRKIMRDVVPRWICNVGRRSAVGICPRMGTFTIVCIFCAAGNPSSTVPTPGLPNFAGVRL